MEWKSGRNEKDQHEEGGLSKSILLKPSVCILYYLKLTTSTNLGVLLFPSQWYQRYALVQGHIVLDGNSTVQYCMTSLQE
jgi:hypothetical protein